MASKDLISIQQICIHYNIPNTFINALHDYELIEIVSTNKTQYVSITEIKNIEKLIRFHYELEINLEGMNAILNLLNKIESLQNEINKLNNKLNFYQDN
tara:strand:+ start:219 stop:515 length:297 start_codon:yes stop_codon:yes gene_type:complete